MLSGAVARGRAGGCKLLWLCLLLLLPGGDWLTEVKADQSAAAAAAAGDHTSSSCQGLLKQFYEFNKAEAQPYNADEGLLYFLHIPRTAGAIHGMAVLHAAVTSLC